MAVVNPVNGARSEVYEEVLTSIAKSGECPFCPGGYTWQNQDMLHEEGEWVISHVDPRYAYKNAKYHLLLFPRTHKEDLTDMTSEDWQSLGALSAWAKEEFDLPAAVLTMRSGDTKYTGATVNHLHAHIFVPDEKDGNIEMVTVHYGPYKK